MTLLVLGFLPPGQALAYGPITRMFDWNAAGAISGYGANDPNWLRNTIYQSILSRGANYPGIVTLQEVCRRQADELQPFMTSLGFGWFGMYHARETTSTCPGETSAGNVGKTRFGNAVWVWGGGPTWASPPFPHQASGTAELRGMTCLGPTAYGTHVCSVHLVSGNVPLADCQANDAFWYVENRYALGDRVVTGGDLNIRAGTSDVAPSGANNRCGWPGVTNPTVVSWAYSNYWEADQFAGSDNRVTRPGVGKIDYVWVKKGWGGYFQDLGITSSQSDHYLLEAFLAW
jgi:hypothetical protein